MIFAPGPPGAERSVLAAYSAVIIAVAAMFVVQTTLHHIIGMIAVRDPLMVTAGIVALALTVPAAGVGRSAVFRVGGVYRNAAFVEMVTMRPVHVALVKIIGVIAMLDGFVATTGLMPVTVILVLLVIVHGILLSAGTSCWFSPTLIFL